MGSFPRWWASVGGLNAQATLETRRPMQIIGAQDYASGQTWRLRFKDVTPLEEGETYVRAVELAIDVVLESDLAGTVDVPELVLPRIVESLVHTAPNGHQFLNLPEQAGRALVLHAWEQTGVYPEITQAGKDGNVTIPNGSTITARMKLTIPFMFLGGIEPDDCNVALRDLLLTQIVGRWGNADTGGIFDSGSNNERATSATTIREATAILVSRDEYRVGAYPSLVQETLAGVEQDIAVNDCLLHSLTEIRLLADGITERYVTDAQRDRIRLRIAQRTLVDRVDAIDLVAGWNRAVARGAGDRLDQHEANTADFIPILFAQRHPRKLTHSARVDRIQPKLRVEGDGNLTTPTVIHFSTRLNKLPTVAQTIRDSRVDVNAAFLSGLDGAARQLQGKTASKQSAAPGTLQALPVKLNPKGDPRGVL